MNSARNLVFAPAILALCVGLGFGSGCKPKAPEGTNPPGENGGEEASGGKRGKRRGKGGGGGPEQVMDPAKECPGEVSDTPTALFPHPESGDPQAFIRVPKGMSKDDLIEQNPFFFMTQSSEGFVSQCDAIVKYMAVGILDKDPKKELKAQVEEFLKNFGYSVSGWEGESADANKVVGAVNANSQAGGDAKLWVSIENKYGAGKLFFVILEAHPNAFSAIQPTYKAVTDSLIVVPPS